MKRFIFTCMAAALLELGVLAQQQTSGNPAQKTPKAPAVSAPKPETNAQYHVIGYLEKADQTITIKSGPRGPVYSVKTKDGKTLFENVPAEQLKAQAPEIHQLIKTGMAADVKAVRP